MPWIMKSGQEYSEATRKFALNAAIAAVPDKEIQLCDVSTVDIERLGRKWCDHLFFLHGGLHARYKKKLDGLFCMASSVHIFACHYEASLHLKTFESLTDVEKSNPIWKRIITAEGCECEFPYGNLVAQHYGLFCRTSFSITAGFSEFPPTGDILMALCINKIVQAARYLSSDAKKSIDLLSDAYSAGFLAAQGEAKIDSAINQKNTRTKNARNAASLKNEDMRRFAIDYYNQEKKIFGKKDILVKELVENQLPNKFPKRKIPKFKQVYSWLPKEGRILRRAK